MLIPQCLRHSLLGIQERSDGQGGAVEAVLMIRMLRQLLGDESAAHGPRFRFWTLDGKSKL